MEWVLLLIPVLLALWIFGRIRGARMEAAKVEGISPPPADPRQLPFTAHAFGGRGRWIYAAASVLAVLLDVASLALVIWGFAAGPDEFENLITFSFIAFAVFGAAVGLLLYQFRAATIAPARISAISQHVGGEVYGTTVSPSLRRFVGDAALGRSRELYLAVGGGISIWADRKSSLVEIGRVSADQIISVGKFGLPRSAGVDEALVRISMGDDRKSTLNVRPFTRAYSQARALTGFIAAVSAVSAHNPSR